MGDKDSALVGKAVRSLVKPCRPPKYILRSSARKGMKRLWLA